MKNANIMLRVSETEKKAYVQLARYEQASLSEITRMLLRQRAQQVGLWPVEVKQNGSQKQPA